MRSEVVFAGGHATRLSGVNKALLEVGGVPIICRTLATLEPLTDEILAVVNDSALEGIRGLRLVRDPDPHAGVLPALQVGLREASGELCLVVAGDMPFVSAPLFEHLLALAPDQDLVIPARGGQLEPMHAVYRRETCLAAVTAALERGERRMIAFHRAVRVLRVEDAELAPLDPHELAFLNVNTPEDLARARKLAESGG